MKLSDLLRKVEVTEWGCDPELDVIQITSDSRTMLCDGMFICIEGVSADGHDHISEAVSKGAAVVIASQKCKIPCGVPYVLTGNTRLAEAHIWNNWYDDPSRGMQIAAVTGTNGKTSTVFMLREILKTYGRRVGIISTVKIMAQDEVICTGGGSSLSGAAAAMTTPDPEYLYEAVYLMKQRGVDTLLIELSSHALSQYKADPLKIDVAVFTNLSEEHLDYHGNMDRYFQAKARLAGLSRKLAVNCDDKYMRSLSTVFRDKCVTCSACSPLGGSVAFDVTALRQTVSEDGGVEYIYFSKNAVFKVTSPMRGLFTVYNSMLAGTAAILMGVPPESVKDGIAALETVPGRLEKVELPKKLPFEVYIDYAHTPAALENLLLTVRGMRKTGQKITLLFGCGGERDRMKRRRMGAVASGLADFVIITGDNSRRESTSEIIGEILPGIDREKPHAVIPDRREAIEYAVKEAADGEIIILAGKGHEKYEINASGKVPFDEYEIVRTAAERYR